ncbi:dynein heavy chain 8, axonemal, partial [Aplysia californica]|uniref:Dynein heavy chain 8, axonemal n=1 Tax=Aplysia californica TaxID=6500 RepID=A0ABM1VPH2_APLCA
MFQFLRALSQFSSKDGNLLVCQYQMGPELSFEACGRSYAQMSQDHRAMRLFVSCGSGPRYEGKVVFLLKKSPVALEEKNVSDEVMSGEVFVTQQQGFFGAMAELFGRVFKPALGRLKSLETATPVKPDPKKCKIVEHNLAIDNFTQHVLCAEQHVQEAVRLAVLDDPAKMVKIDELCDVDSCLAAAQSKTLLAVVEEIASLWCGQVEKILMDSDRIRREADDIGPKKELQYWLGQTARFNFLLQQIREKRARMVLHVLHIRKSHVFQRWHELDTQVTDRANEARDNAKYLYTLEKYCEPLYRCQPLAMVGKLTGLIGSIRLIYNYSHYYNSTSKVSSIFVKITNQIVTSCKAYLSDHGETNLWDLPRPELHGRLQDCIKLFQAYISIYNITKKKIDNSKNERPFKFSAMYIFGKIYTFRARIEKILCLMDYCQMFAPLESSTIEGIDTHCARFNSLFNNLRKKGYDLLNYRNQAFDDDFDKFLELVEELKVNLQNFMQTTLGKLKHSLDKIAMMKRFDKLKLPFLDIEGGYASIIALYMQELDSMQLMYERDKEDPPTAWNLPPVAGKIYWVRHMLTHIAESVFLLQSIRPSIMKTGEGKKAIYKYNRFAYVLVKAEVLYHIAWFKSVDMANQCMLEHCSLLIGLYHRSLLYLCIMMLVDYKNLKESVPDMFVPLLQPTMFKIDSLMSPAFSTITWTSLELTAYFKELDKAFSDIKLLMKTDTTCSVADKLNKSAHMVCDTVLELLRIFVNQAFLEYRTLEKVYADEQRIADPSVRKSMNASYTMTAIASLTNSTEPDRSPLPEDLMTREAYVTSCLALFDDFKNRMIDALLKSVRFSLSSLRRRFLANSSRSSSQGVGGAGEDDNVGKSGPFFQVDIELAIPAVVTLVLKKNCYKMVSENKDVMKYSNMGNMAGPLGDQFKKALNSFSEFSFIWTEDRATVMKEFSDSGPDMPDFREKYLFFKQVEQKVSSLQHVILVGPVALNTDPLKLALMVELSEWKRSYGRVLNEMMKTRVNELTEYMASEAKQLSKPVKDLDDVRMAMNSLASVRDNYIRMDEEMMPIEVLKGPMEPGITPMVANDRLQNFQMSTACTHCPCYLVRCRQPVLTVHVISSDVDSLYSLSMLPRQMSTACTHCSCYLVRCRRLPKGLKDWQAYNDLKKKIDDFNETVPLLELMANKCMQGRHWQRIQDAAKYKFDFDVTSDLPMEQVMENVHLKDIMSAPLLPVKDDVEDICISAVKEKDIEAKLKQVMQDWTGRILTFSNFKNRGELLLKPGDTVETISALEDSLMILSSLMSNRYNAPYKPKIQMWVQNLSNTADILDQWIVVQNLWVYLEAVFVGGDIAKQLPQESKRFQLIDKSWMKVMQRAHENDNVIGCCAGDDTMQQILPHLQEQLEVCQKSLTGYLEKKRLLFPRFFFVSDPSLLEILGQASDCHTIQAHLLGIFDNVKNVQFHDKTYDLILGCISREGETIELEKPVRCEGNVEIWLNSLMLEQQQSLHGIIREAYRAITAPEFELYSFLNSFPAQVSLLGIQFLWTKAAEEALKAARMDKKFMVNANNYFLVLLNKLISKTTEDLRKMERVKYETLITIHVHQRDIFDDLVSQYSSFYSILSVCLSWVRRHTLRFRQMYTQAGSCTQHNLMECQGVEILWITAVYTATHMCLTGTATPLILRCYITLAQALWMSMGGAPAGPAGTGKTETTKDMGRCLGKYVVVFNCSDQMDFRGLGRIYKGLAQSGSWGCFDEFNRIELPVLSVAAQQIYIVLSAKKDKKREFIFTDGDNVSLNPEFGIFLTMNPGYAGRQELPENLKVQFRTVSMMVPDRQIIMRVKLASCGFIENIILAQKFYTLYKLCEEQLSKQVDEDEPLFLSLISDLFPGISLDSATYVDLQASLNKRITERDLINYDTWNLKIVQLFETQRVRHGIMTLGPTGAGKTCCIRVLMSSLKDLGQPHREMRMNPKAITAPQMFGRLDAATNDWTDGIFSTLWRRTLKVKKGDHVWLILDGPVDAIWIENLNSVLDDNKTLTLANGDRIPMAPTCKILFEVHNIDNASPATVSRCGMIFMSQSVLPWTPILELCDLLEGLIPPSSEDRKNMTTEYLERLFIFALMWSHGALLELDDRAKLQMFMMKHKSKLKYPKLQGEETIFEFVVSSDGESRGTVHGVLLIGEQGTAKTVMIQAVMAKANPDERLSKSFNFSSASTPGMFQIKMLPTPAKFHYIFNLRDLSRIWQGMLYIEGDECQDERTLVNLWKHEVCRVIEDRFVNEQDKMWFQKTVASVIMEEVSEDVAAFLLPLPHFVDFMREAPEEQEPDEDAEGGGGNDGEEEEEIEVPKIYEMVEDYSVLETRLKSYMKDYNEQIRGAHLDLVFFKDAMIHLMKVSRVIRTPRGAALLVGVGGSGKQSLTRLASFIAGYETFQITLTRSYNVGNLMDDLKHMYRVAGQMGKGITFLFTDNEVKDEGFLEYLNNVLSSGEISNLFARDEIDEITGELIPVMKKEFPRRPPTQENLYDYFMTRARANLHTVLCFSPVGEKFRTRALKFPGLISGCTMDWFSKWPRDALVAVSTHFLGPFEMEASADVKSSLIEMMGSVHDGVAQVCVEYFERQPMLLSDQTIKPSDISTVKKLGKPPHLIMRIMDCALLLFRRRIDPNEPDPERPCPKPSWQEALKLMGQMSFLQQLMDFPKDTITAEMVELMEPYTRMEDYTFESALKVCGNVAGLLS